ncbi:hypothetical protein [Streptomyces sp. NPDC053755]|uniref:hypothetical protein n=1 Tax=Streptomyces sp. NPDC053755 TaxID=3155815 RepID=UPI00342B432F
MSTGPGFFTQAVNFTSPQLGGVDPRTGLFHVSVALPELVGSDQAGPFSALNLSYAPLNPTHTGFGRSVTTGLTTYDTSGRLLVLSTGEQYGTQETDASLVLLQSKSMVRIAKEQDAYRVTHRSGVVEVLTGPKHPHPVKVPVVLLSDAGHQLTLTWDFDGPLPRLREVRDATDVLLTVDYDGDSKATLAYQPGTPESVRFELHLQEGRLSRVVLPAGEEYRFAYGQVGGQGEWGQWITGVATPMGSREQVVYSTDGAGHRFADSAALPALPYVTRHTINTGYDQPELQTSYEYTAHNFLAAQTTVTWNPGTDNLYQVLTDYTYGSTSRTAIESEERTVEHTFNRFHLLTTQTTRQRGKTQTELTDYGILAGKSFDDQQADFQQPRATRTEFSGG